VFSETRMTDQCWSDMSVGPTIVTFTEFFR